MPESTRTFASHPSAAVRLAGDGLQVASTPAHPAGILYSGGYDADENTLYLSTEIGHPQGVSSAGGDPSKDCVSGMRILIDEGGNVYWATDSMSLPRRLRDEEAASVQSGLQLEFHGRNVRRVDAFADARNGS